MEGVTVPLRWEQWPEAGTKIFKLFRSEAGEELVLDKNFFVERILFADPIAPMSDETKEEYLRPFLYPGEDRRPTLTFPRHIPLDEEPGDTFIEIKKNAEFHKKSNIPKLFINADGFDEAMKMFDICDFDNRDEWSIYLRCGARPTKDKR